MVEDANKQKRALAEITVDKVLPSLFMVEDRIISMASHVNAEGTDGQWTFEPRVLTQVNQTDLDLDEDRITEAALTAFPDDAANIQEVVLAARNLLARCQEYDRAPWERGEALPSGLFPTTATDLAINRLRAALHTVVHLLPHQRAARKPE